LGVEPKTILIVEPDDDLRSTMIRVLQRSGFDVESAVGAQEAVDRMSQGVCRLIVASAEAADAAGANLLKAAGGHPRKGPPPPGPRGCRSS
jgi:DNA-binding NtrC family response regulator